MIQVQDLHFKPYLSEDEIAALVTKVASELTANYNDKSPLFVVILKGAFVFAADLLRKCNFPCQVEFLAVSSYAGGITSSGALTFLTPLPAVKDRHVIIVEDIIDTGLTVKKLSEVIAEEGAAEIAVAALLRKPEVCKHEFPLLYVGKDIPPDFIVGYGLDYGEYGRNLGDIYVKN